MRKAIAIILVILAIGGSAMAINSGIFSGKRATNNTRTQVAQPQAENLIDIATEAPVVTAEPTATPVVTAEPTATPAPVNPLRLDAEEGFRLMQNNEYGACNALFVDSGVQYERVELVWTHDFEVEVMVAGSYVSIVADGYSFTGTKDAKAVVIEECDIHDGVFFNWTTRYKGEKVRFMVTEEVVEEINKFFGCWNNNVQNQLTYGLLCDRHDGSGSVAHSNAGNSNGGEQPVKPTQEPTAEPTATPAPSQAPTAEPTATPVPSQAPTAEPTETVKIDWDEPTQAPSGTPEPPRTTVPPTGGSHSGDPKETTAPNQGELDQGGRKKVEGGGQHSAAPTQEDASAQGGGQHSAAPAQEEAPAKQEAAQQEAAQQDAPAQQDVSSEGQHSAVPEEDNSSKEEVVIDWE